MSNEVSIVNQALGFLGANTITALTDNSTEAKLAKTLYADLRDACLEEGDWTFATRGLILPKSSEEVVFGSGALFPLPDYVLRVIEVNENRRPWVLEERKIVVEGDVCQVLCIVRVTNVNLMSAMFRQGLAARMAWDMALPLTNSKTMHDTMFQLYQQKMDFAKANDGMQGTTKKIRSFRFTDVRGQGSSNVAGATIDTLQR